MAGDVFISYSSKEVQTANIVRKILEDNNISCWMAPDSIPAGGNYMSVIPKAISECQIMVLVLSEESQKSIWVPKEVEQAINKHKLIIPFLIENCKIEDVFSFIIGNSQRIDAYIETTKALQKLVKNVKAILNEDIDENNIVNSVENFEIKQKTSEQPVNGNIITDAGDIYEGTLINNIPNGKGKMEYANGDIYEGFWKDGKKTGKGKMIYANGEVYEGAWKNDLPNGKGKCTWQDGTYYDGDWVDGEKTGKGHFEKTSESYTGDLVRGRYEGHGIYIKRKFIYNAESKKGYYSDNDFEYTYNGDFKDGKFDGSGKISYINNSKIESYEGEWKDGKFDGKGEIIYLEGKENDYYGNKIKSYNGEWKDDKKEGKGTLKYYNNCLLQFDGEFKNDKPNGYGELSNLGSDDKMIDYKKGTWKDGKFISGNVRKYISNLLFVDDCKIAIECEVNNEELIGEYKFKAYRMGEDENSYTINVKYGKYVTGETRLIWENNMYTGEVKNGIPNGYGKLEVSHLGIIEGNFTEGCINKEEKIKSINDEGVYEGTIEFNGIRQEGKQEYKNGGYYVGKWYYDNEIYGNGFGKKFFDDGFYEGEYLNGEIAGKGKYIWNNGDWYDGEWKDGKMNGKGKYKISQTGVIEDVEYYEGRRI